MAVKKIEVAGVGMVAIYKRRGNRSIRLSITPSGQVRVTLPQWTPYQAGVSFAQSRAAWIVAERSKLAIELTPGQPIGKSHYLYFKSDARAQKIRTRITGNQAIVVLPTVISSASPPAQAAARAVAIRALRREAEQLLPGRLRELAGQHGLSYSSVAVRHLKSRWGSCSQRADITLNLFLVQLPWPLIDYVLLHELTHTKVMHHGPIFWAELERHAPNARELRKEIHRHQPTFS